MVVSDLHDTDLSEAGIDELLDRRDVHLGSGPQATSSVMSSSRTVLVAASKFTGFGSSDITFHPLTPNLKRMACWRAFASSVS